MVGWEEGCTIFCELFLLPLVHSSVPLVMTEVEAWKEGEFYQREAWGRGREREWPKWDSGLGLWLSFIIFGGEEAEVLTEWETFQLDFMIDWVLLLDRLVFMTHSLFLSPITSLSLSLPLTASGQPVRFSEWLSPLRLRGLIIRLRLCRPPFPHVTVHSYLLFLSLTDHKHQEAGS